LIYRRRASPLHAARAGVGCAYCLALALAVLLLPAPILLGALVISIAGAAVFAGVGREIRHAALLALPLGLLVMAVNMLVAQGGLTVIARLGDLPVFGQTDVTLEATVYGAVLGVRAAALILCGALYTAAIDPDAVLALFRRCSFHSALTATLATRMVPVLARDARRLADAQRCRPGPPPSRARLIRATTAGVLDRALDVAAALEVRGYGAARRPGPQGGRARPGRVRSPYSRHDLAFAASAVGLIALAIGARVADLAPFSSDPSLYAPLRAGGVAVATAIVLCALLPFADRRGIER
jgi:energy-coupling factor transport system permease protein